MASFLSDYLNLLLMAVAAVCAGMLAWPVLAKAGTLSGWQAIELINRHNALVIDVRSAQAFEARHVPQSRHIPFDTLHKQVSRVGRNKRTPVLVVAQNNSQGRKAKTMLEEAGYKQVWVADLLKERDGF